MSAAEPLDSITGAILVGTWFSSLLYMAEMMQALYFFRYFRRDWRLRTFVAVAFSVDTVSFLGNYACVYLYLIVHAGDNVYLSQQNWAVPLHLISTGVVAILVQGFLILRYWRFSRNNSFTLVLSLFSLATFGGSLATGLVVVLYPALQDRARVLLPGTFCLITQMCADVLIAVALISQVRKVTSHSKSPATQDRSPNRLVVLTLQTGSATAAIAVGALTAFLINPQTNIPVGIMYSLGRTYMLSMLLNLNMRFSGKPGTSRGTSPGTSSGMWSTGGGGTFTRARTEGLVYADELGLIHVKRIVHVPLSPSGVENPSSTAPRL